jgi:hypothetical protein
VRKALKSIAITIKFSKGKTIDVTKEEKTAKHLWALREVNESLVTGIETVFQIFMAFP